jgi:GT2 family glycosyltransferase
MGQVDAVSNSNEPKISAIIPEHNGGEDLRVCLQSLTQATPPPDELIVVADGDTDDSWRIAEGFRAHVIRTPSPGGPARARNLGARAAQGDILFFVDADVAVKLDAVDQVAAAFKRDPDLAAVFGSYDDQPSAPNFLSQYKNLLHHYVHQTALEEASTFWAGCGAVRRNVFLAVGGFDDVKYREPCIEDIELGYRLKQAGHRIRLHKSLQGKHLKRWNVFSLLRADFFKRALPWTELILRDRQLANDLNLDTSSRVSTMLVYGLVGALLGAILWLGFLAIAGILIVVLLVLNAHVYRFFWRKRGLGFAIRTIPWHWSYYFYSGLAFAIGLGLHLLHRWGLPKPALPAS